MELLFFAIIIPDEFIIIIMGDNLTITTVKFIENLLMKPLQMKVILILIIVEAIVITTIMRIPVESGYFVFRYFKPGYVY